MFRRSTDLRSLLMGLLSIYLFVYPWGILLIALDRVPAWGVGMGAILLILQGTMMGLWLTARYRWRGTLAALLILLISWWAEHLGETSGFPFGQYTYTDVLAPKIINVVPLAIPFAWLLVIPAAVGITDRLMAFTPGTSQTSLVKIVLTTLVAASFATLLDVTIEPVAVHVNRYWIWHDGGGYYSVPLSNFASWWTISALLVWILLWLRQNADTSVWPPLTPVVRMEWLPQLLYLLNLIMFVVINLSNRYLAAASIGLLVLAYLAFDHLEPGVVRWVMGGIERSDTRQGQA